MPNPQPPVITAMVDVGQFPCSTCGKPGDRIVGCQRFGEELVGGRKSCEACARPMARRILPLLEIDCSDTHCEDCCFLEPGPRCGLLTGSLNEDAEGSVRAEECVEAGRRASSQEGV